MPTGPNALHCNHNNKYANQVKRSQFDIKSSDFDTGRSSTKVVEDNNCEDEKPDHDYSLFLSFINGSNIETKSSMKEVTVNDEDADKDPEYIAFLKAFAETSKLCKTISEVPINLEYQKQKMLHMYEPLNHTNTNFVKNKGNVSLMDGRNMQINQEAQDLNFGALRGKVSDESIRKESLRKFKNLEKKCTKELQRHTEVDACYEKLIDGTIKLEDLLSMNERKEVNHEADDMSSDSDVLVLDDVRNGSKGNNDELVTAKEDPSSALKKELRRMLRQPYSRREYKTLSKYVKKQRPIGRLLDLRHRPVTSVLDGSTKSLLSCYPNFKRKLLAAQNDRPKALNLLRGFRYWLEHLPCEGIFKPWLDKKCQKVRPRS